MKQELQNLVQQLENINNLIEEYNKNDYFSLSYEIELTLKQGALIDKLKDILDISNVVVLRTKLWNNYFM